MKLKSIFLATGFSIFFGLSASVHAKLPDDYQSFSSEQKQTILWQNHYLSHLKTPLPKLVKNDFWHVLSLLKGLFSLAPSFDYVSDEMPKKRVKIIHANGSLGKIAFVAVGDHPYTGIYHTGGIGLIRLSVATTPSNDSFIPGMALKFLLPGQPSLNLHVMNALDGQGKNWNFFANEFSNHIAHPTSISLKTIEKIFEWTKKPANELNASHLAAWDNLGHKIDSPISPEKLIFKPAESVRNIIKPDSREDFRLSLMMIPYGAIYEVYGISDKVEYHIGTLYLESNLLASTYSDESLFFQHQR